MDIYNFYNSIGWKKKNKAFEDANLFEDLRKSSKNYVSNCRKRILNHIPKKGTHILDFASGPIQYPEYLHYSKNYKTRHCVDFSKDAIKLAKKKLGKKGKFYCGDFLKLKFKKNFFDCSISLHTIYHLDKTQQKTAIEKLIKITKPGSPIIIVYSNPDTIINKFKKIFGYNKTKKKNIYFFCHPLKWWYQFDNHAKVDLYPWRSFASQHQKKIFFNNYLGKKMLYILFKLENIFQKFFVNNFQYYIVVLKKH
tara:strand:+ start:3505 stop:4260 length:756 start_codon:yes stop_codon:yes gene_type:complete